MLDDGNHGCANVAPWHRPRTADWLAEHLGGRVTAPAGTTETGPSAA
ncbi:hypothetical protein GCM10025868_22590 [Angustibacter aerolatus]|uniref:Uncharacterized protein n=1 Tax=Angustibacter aerolatus TaxID=1162965 RepID=A0ABQ6JI21_9ACTN|nr:hypothetical protein [Angustibacter aerolatus]GMA87009.1 hypothetical protein GCM10025868_22590 [Angustibacter aerolatus]